MKASSHHETNSPRVYASGLHERLQTPPPYVVSWEEPNHTANYRTASRLGGKEHLVGTEIEPFQIPQNSVRGGWRMIHFIY